MNDNDRGSVAADGTLNKATSPITDSRIFLDLGGLAVRKQL
jgi:hypothetical protein